MYKAFFTQQAVCAVLTPRLSGKTHDNHLIMITVKTTAEISKVKKPARNAFVR